MLAESGFFVASLKPLTNVTLRKSDWRLSIEPWSQLTCLCDWISYDPPPAPTRLSLQDSMGPVGGTSVVSTQHWDLAYWNDLYALGKACLHGIGQDQPLP